MGRKFVLASGNYIQIGTAAGLAGFDWRWGTFAAVFNFSALPTAGSGHDLFSTNNAVGACIDFNVNNPTGPTVGLDYYDGTSGTTTPEQIFGGLFSTNTTYLVAVTKATGAVAPRGHLYVPSTNTWTHTVFPSSRVDSAANTSLTLGAADNTGSTTFGVDGEMFAVAAWPSYAMSDLEVERLARGDWGRLNPGLYDLWDGSRDNGDMVTTLGRFPVKQTARVGGLRGTLAPPSMFRTSPVRHRR